MKDRLLRAVRANLNDILDRVHEFEDRGGFQQFVDPLAGGFDDTGRSAPDAATRGDKTIRDYYANLEVPYGADLDTVRAAYRELMRKYHPDRHSGDPERERLATQLTQELTRAYQAIESYLKTGRY